MSRDPIQICWQAPGEEEHAGELLRALAQKLADDGLRDMTIREIVVMANLKRIGAARPPLDDFELEVIVRTALKGAAESRGVPMGPVDITSDEGRQALAQSRAKRQKHVENPQDALRSYVRCTLRVHAWNPHTVELDAETQGGARLQLPIGSDTRALQVVAGATIGSLTSYAQKAHPKCTGADVLRILWDYVPHTPVTDMSSDDALPVRLVRALLGATVWVTRQFQDGMRTRQASERFILLDRPGLYPTCGVGLLHHAEHGPVLFANLEKASTEVLRSHVDFKQTPIRDLGAMLARAPGYAGIERGRHRDALGVQRWRVERWHRVALEKLPTPPEVKGEVPEMTDAWEDPDQPQTQAAASNGHAETHAPEQTEIYSATSVPSVPTHDSR